jgi:hypothetical protein
MTATTTHAAWWWPWHRLSLREQRIQAMVSVHAHAELRRLDLPRKLRIMDLDDAVKFLARDSRRDFFGKARRHRALAKLLAYDRGLFRPAIAVLAGEDLMQRLDHIVIAGDTPQQKEQSATKELAKLDGKPFPNCDAQELSYNVDPTMPMTISSAVSVRPSSFATLERALDPQNWDVCSKFWNPPEHTYLATRSGGVVTMKPAVPSDSAYQHPLYEHFQTTTCTTVLGIPSCHTADFENMLDITSAPGSGTYRADYDFVAPPITGSMDGSAVTIKTDDGYLMAEPDAANAGRWIVTGKKFLEFEEDVANDWALLAFGYGLKELAAEVADIACCDVSALAPPTLLSVESVP